ncbi:hypothetical protein V8B97DRAFT_1433948 [Scleroderma yunnanense]
MSTSSTSIALSTASIRPCSPWFISLRDLVLAIRCIPHPPVLIAAEENDDLIDTPALAPGLSIYVLFMSVPGRLLVTRSTSFVNSSSKTQVTRFPTPCPQQALLFAYHYILTHPVTREVYGSLHTSNRRWDTLNTFYAISSRVSAISPLYPVPVSTMSGQGQGVDEKKSALPPAPPKAVFSSVP